MIDFFIEWLLSMFAWVLIFAVIVGLTVGFAIAITGMHWGWLVVLLVAAVAVITFPYHRLEDLL